MKTMKTKTTRTRTEQPAAILVGDTSGVATGAEPTGANSPPTAAPPGAGATTPPEGGPPTPPAPTLPTSADPVPVAGPPSPPLGFVLTKIPRGPGVQPGELKVAAQAGAELANCPNYRALFGAVAPDPQVVGDRLVAAAGWSRARANAQIWFNYTKEQEHIAWQQTREMTDVIRAPFAALLVQNPQLVATLPYTAQLFAVAKARAQKGIATKKRAASTKKKAVAKMATVPPAVALPALPTAPAPTAPPVTH